MNPVRPQEATEKPRTAEAFTRIQLLTKVRKESEV
jgi:hypothetical protein